MVAGCQKGDRRAMDTLVRQLQKPVYNSVYRMLGNAEEAADVTQTTFLKVFENIQNFDPQFRLFSWTYRIAMNEAIDQLERRRRTTPLSQPPATDTDSPVDETATSQLNDEVQSTLMELNEDHRAVIVLRYFGERSYHDISRILDIPEKTVKSRLFTARQQLRSRLQEHGVYSS